MEEMIDKAAVARLDVRAGQEAWGPGSAVKPDRLRMGEAHCRPAQMAPRESSPIWDHFEKVEGGGRCKMASCRQVVKRKGSSTSTKCFWDHLLWKYPILHARVKGNARAEPGPAEQTDQGQPPAKKQLTLQEANTRGGDAARIEEQQRNKDVFDFLIDANLPFSIVERPSFRNIIHRAYKGVQNDLPHRRYFSDTLLPKISHEKRSGIVKLAQERGFAMTCDLWSRKDVALLSLTVHTLLPNFDNVNGVLACVPCGNESHTAEFIAETITQQLQSLSIPQSNVTALIRDGAANMVKAATILGLPGFRCVAHVLHSCVIKGMRAQSIVVAITEKCKRLAEFFNRSTRARNILRDLLKSKKRRVVLPSQDVCIRWNSTLEMLRTTSGVNDILPELSSKLGDRNTLPDNLEESECAIVSRLIHLLEVVESQSKMVCRDDAPCSLIIPMCVALSRFLDTAQDEPYYSCIKQTVVQLKKSIDREKSVYASNETLQMATFVDPRWVANAALFPSNEWHHIEDSLIRYIRGQANNSSQPISDSEQDDSENDEISAHDNDDRSQNLPPSSRNIWDNLFTDRRRSLSNEGVDKYKDEVDRFKRVGSVQPEADIFAWFKQNQANFPLMATGASLLLAIPPTSVCSERLFSKATLVYSNKLRGRLGADKAQQLLIAKANPALQPVSFSDDDEDS